MEYDYAIDVEPMRPLGGPNGTLRFAAKVTFYPRSGSPPLTHDFGERFGATPDEARTKMLKVVRDFIYGTGIRASLVP